jgi:hypothetical protein
MGAVMLIGNSIIVIAVTNLTKKRLPQKKKNSCP